GPSLPPAPRRPRAGRASCSPDARAVSETVIPASCAATSVASSEGRMQPGPMRSSDAASQAVSVVSRLVFCEPGLRHALLRAGQPGVDDEIAQLVPRQLLEVGDAPQAGRIAVAVQRRG